MFCGNDGPTARDFFADEFRRDEFRQSRAERFAFMLMIKRRTVVFESRLHRFKRDLPPEIFANRDIFHLRRDDALAGRNASAKHFCPLLREAARVSSPEILRACRGL